MTETRLILTWLDKIFDTISCCDQSESGKNEWIESSLKDWVQQWQEQESDHQTLAIRLCKGLATVKLIPHVDAPRSLFRENDSIRWSLIVDEILLRFQLIPY